MDDDGWICHSCTYRNEGASSVCAMCSTDRSAQIHHIPFFYPGRSPITARTLRSLTSAEGGLRLTPSFCSVPRLLAGALSGAVTGMFAVVGAFTGAVTGALAGRATDSGLLRGAGLGAVAGAVLSVEVLEASRAYWHSGPLASQDVASVVEFIEEILNGRFSHSEISSAENANRWQVNVADMSYEDLYGMFGPGVNVIKGASEASLEMLPKYLVTKDNSLDAHGDSISCAICLQELQQGEIVRNLPRCNHMFHMSCLDKWLVIHGSCPMCRQDIGCRT
ncbi:hypothetical protein KP509_04G019800 [Ceratopteris richardii]|uniref:RING-type domain-containing protein n=1 Tax=Ceratopteris richardii TaxID=49495 RepID=A0A8T2V2U7_CERRI|nr:hypothetical protein KP509_04G019800 [Ceratopteris richardii]